MVGESAIRDIAEIGSKVIHTFHIVNDGPWQADGVNVHIDWPYQVETGSRQGKWLLYLTDPVEISPPGVGKCFINPRNINFLGLRQRIQQSDLVTSQHSLEQNSFHHSSQRNKLQSTNLNSIDGELSEKDDEYFSSSSFSKQSIYTKTVKSRTVENKYSSSYDETVNRRYKREVEHVIQPDSVLTEDGSVSSVVVFDCGRKTAKCFTISCNLPSLKRRDFAVIKLRSRVWNSTLVEVCITSTNHSLEY